MKPLPTHPLSKNTRVFEALNQGIRIGDTFGFVKAIQEIEKQRKELPR